MKKFLFYVIVFLSPVGVFAQNSSGPPNISEVLEQCNNGECGFDQLIALVNELLKWAMLATTTFATIMFVYAGFLYISAQGDTNQIKKAHNIFKVVIIGFIIIFCSFLIIKELLDFLGVDPRIRGLLDN